VRRVYRALCEGIHFVDYTSIILYHVVSNRFQNCIHDTFAELKKWFETMKITRNWHKKNLYVLLHKPSTSYYAAFYSDYGTLFVLALRRIYIQNANEFLL